MEIWTTIFGCLDGERTCFTGDHQPDIQLIITLSDTFLIHQIDALIEEGKKADTLLARGFREYHSVSSFPSVDNSKNTV